MHLVNFSRGNSNPVTSVVILVDRAKALGIRFARCILPHVQRKENRDFQNGGAGFPRIFPMWCGILNARRFPTFHWVQSFNDFRRDFNGQNLTNRNPTKTLTMRWSKRDRLLICKARTQLLTKERSGPEQLLEKTHKCFVFGGEEVVIPNIQRYLGRVCAHDWKCVEKMYRSKQYIAAPMVFSLFPSFIFGCW